MGFRDFDSYSHPHSWSLKGSRPLDTSDDPRRGWYDSSMVRRGLDFKVDFKMDIKRDYILHINKQF